MSRFFPLSVIHLYLLSVNGGPTFPEGVQAVTSNVRSYLDRLPNPGDGEKLGEAVNASLEAAEKQLADDARRVSLSEVAHFEVHLRLLKWMYAGGCARDYSTVCPTGWEEAQDLCTPPADYRGLCSAARLVGLSTAQKEEFAWKCRASWVCEAPCRKNFSSCPLGWKKAGGALCIAPIDYTGICSPATDFGVLSDTRKAEWAALCSASWQCIE